MKSILRLYLTTSKGNDPFLYRELQRLKIKPKFDNNMHAFFFDAPLPTLFQIAHQSLIAQNMYVQIGQSFPATSESVFMQSLDKIQFKNYLPLSRNLIENLTLSILIRQTKHPISERVMTSFMHNALQKEIVKKQYFRDVLQGEINRDALPTYYQMRQIVERKWEQEDLLQESQQALLQGSPNKTSQLLENKSDINNSQDNSISKENNQKEVETSELSIPYQPHITIYVRRNRARLLLRVNQQPMYKLGWKKRVGWAPVRQSIATAIISQSGELESKEETFLWDPFCGSGTFGLVAAAMHHETAVRLDPSNFNWQHWAIYKPEYLQQYFEDQVLKRKAFQKKLNIICSDIDFKAANYTIQNLKQLLKFFDPICLNQKGGSDKPLIKRSKPTEHWSQILENEWTVGCGDFQKLADSVLLPDRKVTIITNLPYLQARSAQHMPLTQLISVYRRFSRMIRKYKDRIANVFILIDNNSSHLTHPNHFLTISEERWTIINEFESGGRPVGLYAWQHNQIQVQHEDSTSLINQLQQEANLVNKAPDQELTNALTRYRRKLSQIQKKHYYLPEHLKKNKRGWRRVVQKRRRRHLLKAYDLFAKRRDKMIAFSEYAKKKLEVQMLKRGSVWRKRNTKILAGLPIENLEKQLKKEFEGRIQEAITRNQQKEQYRRQRAIEANQARKSKPSKQTKASANPRTRATSKLKPRRK